ncbi:hypothetical protein ACFT54_09670 [Streptomyces cinereoruber]|uniref:hypothetical protein n=1 Tax=Streptomyces cinereoruber TaxID=67260 RepID=UPI00362A5B5F
MGTAAWHLARVNATRLATDMPLEPGVEGLLRALADGEHPEGADEPMAHLHMRGMAEIRDQAPCITELGRVYLRAKDGRRTVTRVKVLAVDDRGDFARVSLPHWHDGEGVVVLAHQVMATTGLGLDVLPGLWLDAEANLDAEGWEDLVLTRFQHPTPPQAPAPGAVPEPMPAPAPAPAPVRVPEHETVPVPLWTRVDTPGGAR